MRFSKRTIATALTLFICYAGSASAQEVHFLWSGEHNEVLAKHNATLYTPTEQPMPAVDWRFNRADAQDAYKKAYPRERRVIQPIRVERNVDVAESAPSTMDFNGRQVEIQNW